VAHSPRGWTGTRTPSGKKRVRQAERRAAINGPRASKAKTLVSKTIKIATGQLEGDASASLAEAFSALDRAAKGGAIHPNAAARRKSRLAKNVGAALGGAAVQAGAKPMKTTGTAAAAKAAKARIAAGKAAKAKGAQTAAGKARAALARAGRTDAEVAKAKAAPVAAEAVAPKARTTRAKATEAPAEKPAAKAPAKKAPARKAPAKAAAKAPAKAAAKAPARKPAAKKAE
jgi:ribosomal protein S20